MAFHQIILPLDKEKQNKRENYNTKIISNEITGIYIRGFTFQMCNDNDRRNSITRILWTPIAQTQKREQNKKTRKKKRVAANFRQKGAASCNPW